MYCNAPSQVDSERSQGLLSCCRLRPLFFESLRSARLAGFAWSWRPFYSSLTFSIDFCKVRAPLPQI